MTSGQNASYLSFMAASFSDCVFSFMSSFGTVTRGFGRMSSMLSGGMTRRLVVCSMLLRRQRAHFRQWLATLPSTPEGCGPDIVTAVLGFDESYQWISSAAFSNEELQTFMSGMKELERQKINTDENSARTARTASTRKRARNVCRHSMVQTLRIYSEDPRFTYTSQFVVLPRLVWRTTMMVIGTAVFRTLELFTGAHTFIHWLRNCPFRYLLFILVADGASSNVLFFKVLKAAQHMLLPKVVLLLWYERCGLHKGSLVSPGHLNRRFVCVLVFLCFS